MIINMKIGTKRIALSVCVFITLSLLLSWLNYIPSPRLMCSVIYEKRDVCQIYEGTEDPDFTEDYSVSFLIEPGQETALTYRWDRNLAQVRIDLGNQLQECQLTGPKLKKWNVSAPITENDILFTNSIEILQKEENSYTIRVIGEDPYIIFSTSESYTDYCTKMQSLVHIGVALIATAAALFVFFQYRHSKILIFWAFDILRNFKLIIDLAVSDFKTKYAACYLGIIWAFVQPIVTISIYVVVFGYGFKSMPVKDFPFVLWLSAGIIPWLFFSDALMSATTSLKEYSFLVKKVVFEIKVLPIVKIIASFYIHLVFIGIVTILYVADGYIPTVYNLQLIYYAFCTLVIVLGVGYITSALNVFVPDLVQIVNIILQFGMWMTPIMWSPSLFGPVVERIIKINPMYYIVEGYRDSFYNHIPFWDKPGLTIYFWCIALILLIAGMYTFRKLEKHFADVL